MAMDVSSVMKAGSSDEESKPVEGVAVSQESPSASDDRVDVVLGFEDRQKAKLAELQESMNANSVDVARVIEEFRREHVEQVESVRSLIDELSELTSRMNALQKSLEDVDRRSTQAVKQGVGKAHNTATKAAEESMKTLTDSFAKLVEVSSKEAMTRVERLQRFSKMSVLGMMMKVGAASVASSLLVVWLSTFIL
ncbi:hypothetical protein [Faecalicoccus pleomorphus]|nr:hypothetical protein [Faecalicoccus pleomorphus]